MTSPLIVMDVAPDPVGVGALLTVVLLVAGFIILLAVGLVVFLWYRKRSLRGVEMIRPEAAPAGPAQHAQPSNPNQL
jgi:flagellar basal body-associated protein FliL